MKKITALFFLVLLSISCKNDSPRANTYTGSALGTTYQVKYFSSENFNTEKADELVRKNPYNIKSILKKILH